MKNIRSSSIALLGVVFIISGCALNNMVKLAKESQLTVTPNPLELHAGKVNHELSINLPPKILPSGKIYTVYTFYKYADQTLDVGSKEFKSENYPSNSSQPTPYKESFSFDYVEGMNPGTLMLYGVATDSKNGKTKTTDTLQLAKGIILTSTHAKPSTYVAYANHNYIEREELIPTNINFYFPQSRSNVLMRHSIKGDINNREKNKKLNAFIAEKNVTRTVTITGTHSPEGPESLNVKLSENRAKAIEKIYRNQMRKYDYKGVADEIEFIQKPVFQDWSAFKQALDAYEDISEDTKSEIKNIINGTGTFQDKEKAIQKVAGYKKIFKEIYPALRSAQTNILTVKEKKTPEEIAVLASLIVKGEVSADTLSIDEMLFAAEKNPSLEEKRDIYLEASKKTESWVAHNNLAATHIELHKKDGNQANLDNALTQLEIATKLNPKSVEVKVNKSAIHIIQGDYDQAYDILQSEDYHSNENFEKISSMKGVLEILKGNYTNAKTVLSAGFDDPITNFNNGLANILLKDYELAGTYLNKSVNDKDFKGISHYLLAINAARKNKVEALAQNLKIAVDINPDFKELALNDLEFRNFANQVSEALK